MKNSMKKVFTLLISSIILIGSTVPAFAANELPGQALGASGVTQNLTVANPWGQYAKQKASYTDGMYRYDYTYKVSYYIPIKPISSWVRGSISSKLSYNITSQTTHSVKANSDLSISLPIKYVTVSAGTSTSTSTTVSATVSKTYDLRYTVTNFDPSKRYAFFYYGWVDHYLCKKTQVKNLFGAPITPKVISITDYYTKFKSPTIEIMWGW